MSARKRAKIYAQPHMLMMARFCYLGKKRLEKAIAAYKTKHPESNDTFTTTWYPFYLDPHATTQNKIEMYNSKFGEARAKMIRANMTQTGIADGINFKWGGKTGTNSPLRVDLLL
jgi:predicted DsbA family dithiol-disulfide isomerase